MEVRVKLDLYSLYNMFKGDVLTPRKLARALGISTKTAGKVLAKMEQEGLARRISRRAYKIEKVNKVTHIIN